MIPGNRTCPACGSADTELALTLGNRAEYNCMRCSNIWAREIGGAELRHEDPLVQWGKTGEDDGI